MIYFSKPNEQLVPSDLQLDLQLSHTTTEHSVVGQARKKVIFFPF